MDLDAVMLIASMTKPLTSVAATQLVEQGKLRLDGPAAEVIPALGVLKGLEGWDTNGAPQLRDANGQLSLRHLLTHTSSVTDDIWNADLERFSRTQNVPGMLTGQKAALRVPLCFDPGARWEYGIGTDSVGQLGEAWVTTSIATSPDRWAWTARRSRSVRPCAPALPACTCTATAQSCP